MRKTLLITVVAAGAWLAHSAHVERAANAPAAQMNITIVEDGVPVRARVAAQTVGAALAAAHMPLREGDRSIPAPETPLRKGMAIDVVRARHVTIVEDGRETTQVTYAHDVAAVLSQLGVTLAEADEVTPSLETVVHDGMTIRVAHVTTRDEQRTITLPFATVKRDDKTLPFGTTKIVQKGIKGQATVTERVVLKGGTEVKRTQIDKTVTRAPQDEIIAVGTKVRLGKKHTGQASWYAYKGCDCAANPWLPKGSHVKVTNRANGKSVIVRINDRGPFVPGRIIDLDVTAFKKIASKGAGVIDVIMEEVKE